MKQNKNLILFGFLFVSVNAQSNGPACKTDFNEVGAAIKGGRSLASSTPTDLTPGQDFSLFDEALGSSMDFKIETRIVKADGSLREYIVKKPGDDSLYRVSPRPTAKDKNRFILEKISTSPEESDDYIGAFTVSNKSVPPKLGPPPAQFRDVSYSGDLNPLAQKNYDTDYQRLAEIFDPDTAARQIYNRPSPYTFDGLSVGNRSRWPLGAPNFRNRPGPEGVLFKDWAGFSFRGSIHDLIQTEAYDSVFNPTNWATAAIIDGRKSQSPLRGIARTKKSYRQLFWPKSDDVQTYGNKVRIAVNYVDDGTGNMQPTVLETFYKNSKGEWEPALYNRQNGKWVKTETLNGQPFQKNCMACHTSGGKFSPIPTQHRDGGSHAEGFLVNPMGGEK